MDLVQSDAAQPPLSARVSGRRGFGAAPLFSDLQLSIFLFREKLVSVNR